MGAGCMRRDPFNAGHTRSGRELPITKRPGRKKWRAVPVSGREGFTAIRKFMRS